MGATGSMQAKQRGYFGERGARGARGRLGVHLQYGFPTILYRFPTDALLNALDSLQWEIREIVRELDTLLRQSLTVQAHKLHR